MRIISTRMHGMMDYIVGSILIIAPWLLGFYRGGWESWVPVILGAGTIVMSLMTDYELGVRKIISMRTHLRMDLISGILLALWICRCRLSSPFNIWIIRNNGRLNDENKSVVII